jgi:NAD(P)-dependent dehydrogenase (short-subunit alcohol dehydrogenase family)
MGILDRFRLSGRVAMVTGGNRGLGRAIAGALAEAGARVAIASRKAEEAQAAAGELESLTGQVCHGYECDVGDSSQVKTLVSQVLIEFGQIDILVNNAGINIRGAIESLSVDEFRQVQETNVTGVWLMCREVAPFMKARRYGRVINMGSVLSVVAMPDRTPYAASKGAVLQLTRVLALEWAPYGITVNAILPGHILTEMDRPLLSDRRTYQSFVAQIPLGRLGEPEEIQGLALFLASDASSFVTGSGIAIDGGMTAR